MTSTTRPTRHQTEQARIGAYLDQFMIRWIADDDYSTLYTTEAAALAVSPQVERIYVDNDEMPVDVVFGVRAIREAVQAERDETQRLANALHGEGMLAEARDLLVAEFERIHAEHPQYAGWTDDTILVRARRSTPSSTFVRYLAGDVLLAKPVVGSYAGMRSSQTAFCPRVGWNVEVGYDVEPI